MRAHPRRRRATHLQFHIMKYRQACAQCALYHAAQIQAPGPAPVNTATAASASPHRPATRARSALSPRDAD
ncbi:hypothetical protein RA210_U70156 [Rubrivivax sp. A210]|nr:hypothetical protein RA210_U70156 [Rubrivivax sp. A210]